MTETGSPDPVRRTDGDRIDTWPQRPRALAWPLRLLVFIAFMFALFMIAELIWPSGDEVEWASNLVLAVALVLAIAAGDALATRLYGPEALERVHPMVWRAFGVLMITMFVVAFAILQLGRLVT